jgi:hypothetical protein
MPSPFPGMDPYLEHPARWPDVRHELISASKALLNRQFGGTYRARVEERVYVSQQEDPGRQVLVPDVLVRRDVTGRAAAPFRHQPDGATAVIPVECQLVDEEIREARISIIDVRGRRVVTVIEFVSPSNKVWGSEGRKNYDQKKRDIRDSTTHLVEIDLLRGGTPLYAKEMLPPHDYLVHVSRYQEGQTRRHQFWPIPLRERLPDIPIPLLAGDDDATLNLQAVLDETYERSAYDRDIEYLESSVPPLDEKQAEWARSVLARAGFEKTT